MTVRRAVTALSVTILLTFGTGCLHWTTMRSVPPPAAILSAPSGSTVALVIDSVSGTLNGNSAVPNPAFVQSYASGMRDVGFFAPVFEPSPAQQAKPDPPHKT